jgi:NitT/TauT family transport system permease protein
VPTKRQNTLYAIGGVALLLIVWQLLASFGGTGFILPSPWAVLKTFARGLVVAESWQSVGTSTGRILLSVLRATVFAVVFAWLAAKWRPLRGMLAPIVLVIKSVPIVSFILIALFFLSDARLTPFICGLVVFPMVYGQLLSGILNVDRSMLEMGDVFRLKKRNIVRYIVIPSVRESFLAALSVAIGMAWKAGVAAEVITFAKQTVGRHMYDAKLYLDMERLLAWTLAVVLLSYVSEQIIVRLSRAWLVRFGERLPGEFWSHPSADPPETSTSVTAPPTSPAPIEVRHLDKRFGDAVIFDDFSATLPLDRPLMLIGASGSGKTTLMRIMMGLEAPDAGRIEGVPDRPMLVFQENRLFPQLTARDNIRLVLPDHDGARADALLAALDLSHVKDQAARTLSGGEKRRLALARGAAPASGILFLDEAFRELDDERVGLAVRFVADVAKTKPVVIASHDLTLIDRLQANVVSLDGSFD